MGNEPIQGMSRLPTSRYDVSYRKNMGWPVDREVYGHGVVVVVVGVTSHLGERESRLQGEARQVIGGTDP